MSTTITVNGYEVEVFDFQHNSYAFIPTGDGIAWSVAYTQAQGVLFEEVNGRLATINSPEENTFIVDNISPFVSSQGDGDAWLGGYQSSSGWAWITGEDWTYTNWAVGQPNYDNTYARLYFSSGNNLWYDTFYSGGDKRPQKITEKGIEGHKPAEKLESTRCLLTMKERGWWNA